MFFFVFFFISNLIMVSEVTYFGDFIWNINTEVSFQPLSVTPEKVPLFLSAGKLFLEWILSTIWTWYGTYCNYTHTAEHSSCDRVLPFKFKTFGDMLHKCPLCSPLLTSMLTLFCARKPFRNRWPYKGGFTVFKCTSP